MGTSLIKDIFHITGSVLFSFILMSFIFGAVAQEALWTNIEPVFERQWETATFTNGRDITENYDALFVSLTESN